MAEDNNDILDSGFTIQKTEITLKKAQIDITFQTFTLNFSDI